MIYYYKIDGLRYTPFDENFWLKDFKYLASNGLKPTVDKKTADLYISSNTKDLKRFILRNPSKKNYLLWTNEPRNSTTGSDTFYPLLLPLKVHVMNVYTNNVFVSNVNYQEQRFSQNQPLIPLKNNFNFNNKKVVVLMSYYNGGKNSRLVIRDCNIDLVKMRSDIAIYGFNQNLIDIYGAGWPEGMSIEDSRTRNWVLRKKELLFPYNFNLCFENTVYPKYITEKIWDSIENYCLPIYYGGQKSSIYEVFPKDSFIDYADFKNPIELFEYIRNVDEKEYIRRMNLCLKVYNSFIENSIDYWNKISKQRLDFILKKADLIVNGKKFN